MDGFAGFPDGNLKITPVPEVFFHELLPLIDDLAELKLTLHCLWLFRQSDREAPYVTAQELDEFTYLPIIFKSGASPPPPDCNSYEPNDTSSQANWIQDGETQTQCIIPETDVDWVKFSVSTKSKVVLEAADQGGDLELDMYDSALNHVGGSYSYPDSPARIDRDCPDGPTSRAGRVGRATQGGGVCVRLRVADRRAGGRGSGQGICGEFARRGLRRGRGRHLQAV